MMLHGSQSPTPGPLQSATATSSTPSAPRKRKAETQDNERLNKRLSLLNLEQNGSKLYVPVEAPTPDHGLTQVQPSAAASASQHDASAHDDMIDDGDDGINGNDDNDIMKLDDTKHKVYIYNIDDELSSDDESISGMSDDGRLVFLPDIEKHLRANRIPRQILANSDGELAGMQVVLYSDPKSLSVPEEKDGVRKAIIEARQRVRDRNAKNAEEASSSSSAPLPKSDSGQAGTPAESTWSGVAASGFRPDSPDAMEVD